MAPAPAHHATLVTSTPDSAAATTTQPAKDDSGLVRPFALGALGVTLLIGAAYVLFRLLHRPKRQRSKTSGLRKLVLSASPTEASGLRDGVQNAPRATKRAAVRPLAVAFPDNFDMSVEDPSTQEKSPPSSDTSDRFPSYLEPDSPSSTSSSKTPPLSDDSTHPEDDSPPIPSHLFDLDNLMATPLEDLQSQASTESEYSERDTEPEDDIADIVEGYYSKSPSLLSFENSRNSSGIGLGISLPIIVLDSCGSGSRIDLSHDNKTTCDDEQSSHDSPVPLSPEEYLAAPPQQHCLKDRQLVEEAANTRARIHRFSVQSVLLSWREDQRSDQVKTTQHFLAGVDQPAPGTLSSALKVTGGYDGWF
ncbi:hypothetical protein EIP91_002237 [Steccherinum ochraceum]|uniref:Uncharacterized protein n=1 Tax=Steccherinum ochraceum TaxID=92696 RepID=A0A4R0RG95_9APHY|nr:hypothetical protein EIP91_002237 [Steccherinum ochraceum]